MRSKVVLLCVLAFGVLAGLSSCGPAGQPIGVMKSRGELLIFIGGQCADAEYPTRVKVVNIDSKNVEVEPPLWQLDATQPSLLPSVAVGRVPPGYEESANHIAEQGIGAKLRVEVLMKDDVVGTFDTTGLQDGQIRDSTGGLTTVMQFRDHFGCGG